MNAPSTTLNAIRAARPCKDGWGKLLAYLGKTSADDDTVALLTILDSNGLDDALWVLSNVMQPEHDRLSRHFQAWCAEQVLPVFEAAHPRDSRVRDQIAMLRNDNASARDRAASSCAARAAASDAASAASWGASSYAASAARAASSYASWGASSYAASAARAASSGASWGASSYAAMDAQERQLRKMLTEGF